VSFSLRRIGVEVRDHISVFSGLFAGLDVNWIVLIRDRRLSECFLETQPRLLCLFRTIVKQLLQYRKERFIERRLAVGIHPLVQTCNCRLTRTSILTDIKIETSLINNRAEPIVPEAGEDEADEEAKERNYQRAVDKVVTDVVEGPVTANGDTWWKVNYDSGVNGWTAENWPDLAPTFLGATTTPAVEEQINSLRQQIELLQQQLSALLLFQ
jgi:hypothetical protein